VPAVGHFALAPGHLHDPPITGEVLIEISAQEK